MRLLTLLLLSAPMVFAAPAFRAGAARVEITPAKDEALPMSGYAGRTQGHAGIHDPLFVRAIALDDGAAPAAIVTAEVIGFSHALWERISDRIAREAGIPRERLLLAGVHTHGAPAVGTYEREPSPKQAAYIARVEDAIVEAVRKAQAALQPARAGAATGRANVNLNRRARTAYGGWWLGVNPDGPSDKTVAVVRFDNAAGEPIAVFSNYAVHGTVMGPQNLRITGDLPGAAARFVEQQMGGAVVAPWTSGAAGDENAIYGPGNEFDQVAILGQILGEEIVRVARGIRTRPVARVRAAQKVVTCPGQRLAPGATRKDREIRFVDADPVSIRLSLVAMNDIALAGVWAKCSPASADGSRRNRGSPTPSC